MGTACSSHSAPGLHSHTEWGVLLCAGSKEENI